VTSATLDQRSNQYDLTGRVAVVTGGAGGLGQSVSTAFARSGALVVVVGRASQRPGVEALAAQVAAEGGQVSFVAADVLDEASVEAMVVEVLARHGRLDVLVNLVGGFTAGQSLTEMDLAVWQRMLDLNVRSTLLVSKYAARPMIQQRWGRILNISSRAARAGRKQAAAYAVAKAAIITLTEAQDEELRSQGITANCILPSIIDTPANRAAMPNAAFARWPRPEEIARVLLFLASDDAKLISGAAIPVYGLA
jgi:NAD(P)-dependent dehydrogenase (short-subunit alcohol dehydrogenase family)